VTDTSLEADLRARWRPSAPQIEAAERHLADHPDLDTVYTVHLLVNKRPFWWTLDVQVIPVDGSVYETRDAAFTRAVTLAQDSFARTGIPTSAGWTIHRPDRSWAVWEI
jgi:hypothetical protein